MFDEEKVKEVLEIILSKRREWTYDGDSGFEEYHYECPYCRATVKKSDTDMKYTEHLSSCLRLKALFLLKPEEFL